MHKDNLKPNKSLATPCQAAFFDLDDTMVDMHTMILFAQFLSRKKVVSEGRVSIMISDIKDAEARGATREQTNGMFFGILEGLKDEDYLDLGYQWWNAADKKMVDPVYKKFQDLKTDGAHVVAVSGSYSCCVQAIGEGLGMTAFYGSEPQISGRILTGSAQISMVGNRKKQQVLDYLAGHPAIRATFAFGDHPSDFPMFSAVNSAIFIHRRPVSHHTLSYIQSQGWETLEIGDSSVSDPPFVTA